MTTRVADTPADAGVARSRPMPKEKRLARGYPPCPHCGITGTMVYHCNDKELCTWLRCAGAVSGCGALIEPSDWSHAYANQATGHGRTRLRRCE
jgi:hypothetical protein